MAGVSSQGIGCKNFAHGCRNTGRIAHFQWRFPFGSGLCQKGVEIANFCGRVSEKIGENNLTHQFSTTEMPANFRENILTPKVAPRFPYGIAKQIWEEQSHSPNFAF
jgi:hypothetical protein